MAGLSNVTVDDSRFDYIISCCSTCDLSAPHLSEIGVHCLPFHYTLDGVEHPDDLGATMSYDDFYAAMANGASTSTSQVSVGVYVDFFTELLSTGKDVFHLAFSSGLSGSYNSAVQAAGVVLEKFPDRKLYVVDSLAASSGYGLFVDKLAELRATGMDIAALRDWAESNELRLHHWFFSTDLTFYVRGGRVSKLRGKKRAIDKCVQMMVEHADGGSAYSDKCYISNAACIGDAEAVKSMVEESFPHINGDVLINSIGTTIGSHTGPGTTALFFWGDER